MIVVATAAVASGSAHAQSSSVTLYGVIDVGIDFTNNSGGKQLFKMQDGTYDGMYGSRWGLKGEEDLGGGLKAIFKLENGFNLNNGTLGQGGREFGRQAWVGLSDARFGTVTLGRQYDSVVDYLQPVTMAGSWGGLAWHASDVDNTANSFRVNNAIKYASPDLNGLTFGGMLGLSNSNAEGTSKIGTWSAGAAYSIGGLSLGASYLFAKQPATLFPDGDYVANTTGAAVGAAGPWSYVGNPGNEQIVGAGATYTLGSAHLGVDYSNVKFDRANGTTSAVKFNNYEAWGSYEFTPAATLVGGYTFTDGNIGYSSAKPKYHQFNLLADYKVSKRTEAYLSAAYEIAAGGQPASIFDGVIGNASSTNHQFAMRVGIVHKF
ncbi:porin [Caballeronia sp. SEWSISQ10-4 2]|uniref:porin n=1 Tax=Caballeronia sp. SEWSISQ10-4 2 TaxID=2937438 RepID=UPI00264F35E2|nr:porin [Caballeronia sp. SEWSISQ10-4 2]MDN7177352.1 porin [Caballeronia sp. SEWSISQ10-4 2]